MAEHAALLDELAVARLLARYCRALDDRRYDDLVGLFTDDAVFETMGRSLRGREEIRGFFPPDASPLTRPESMHVLSNVVADVRGARAVATSDWVMLQRDAGGATTVVLAGRYDDVLVCERDAGWRIYTRTAIALARPTAPPPEVRP